MLLKWIELDNIRSYAHEKLEFPLGTTLLSGDVGCGKSSVLLAVEFALFGIQRGELSGTDLLRHGKNDGAVRLGFEVGGKDVTIHRTLKRDKKGVSQEAGGIDIDGKRYNKTPSELRAIVLDMLGYPLEYQTKNPIVFRYTVYTPQDEMKRILFSDAEERLNILRKIFQIDKYGRIRANADVAIRELRALKREAESLSSDLETKQREADEKREQLEVCGKELGAQQRVAKDIDRELAAKLRELESISEQIRSLGQKAQLAATKESTVRQLKLRNQSIERELVELERDIGTLEKSLSAKPPAPASSEDEIVVKKRELERKRNELFSLQSLLASEIARYKGILGQGTCTFCGQTVEDRAAFAGKIIEKEHALAHAKAEAERIDCELAVLERVQREAAAYGYQIKLYRNSERELKEKRVRSQKLTDELGCNDTEVSAAERELTALRAELSKVAELETLERKAKAELVKIQSRKSEADRTLARIESQIESTTRELGRLEKELATKRQMRDRAARLAKETTWLEQTFIPLMQVIEQTVMSTIQQEFNQVFQSWFGTLIGNENLSVEVDDQFAPTIMQEGYQTEYQNLSGGEKTAVALAYRLALNKAINTLIEGIRTKDLIILDEPTDGFSSEQIDRIRDVLRELNLRQMILVSHEPKIDTFVDNVIRFHKEGHLSRVVRES